MSIQTVEIALPTGIDSVSVGLAEPISIVEVRQGPAGGSVINAATQSDGTADLDLLNVETVTATVSGTLTAPHIHGNLAGSVYAHIRAGENLAKGDPVYVSGSFGSGSTLIPIVSRADASNAAKMPAIGIMDEAVANNANGHMVITGTITELNTAAYSVNAELYVAAGGGMTATPPTARAQPVARVERANANNGAVIVKVNGLSASDATGNTLVRRTSTGGASFGPLTTGPLSATAISSDTHSITSSAGTTITGPLTLSGTGSNALSASYSNTISLTGTTGVTIAGGTLTLNSSGFAYGAGAAAAHRTALGLGTGDSPTFAGATFAGLIEQRNGLNAQESRIYGTFTDASNYRRLALKMSTAGVAQIVAEGAGSGSTGNRIEIEGLTIGKGGGAISTNTAVGNAALAVNTTGSFNTAVGNAALAVNTTGVDNTAIGTSSLALNTTGSQNSSVGRLSLSNLSSGGYNVSFGSNAGRFISGGAALSNSTNSVYLGAETKALASGQSNQIVIGHSATGLGSNTAVLGNDSIVTTALKGNVGIGTTSPAQRLDVVGSIKASQPIIFPSYTVAALPAASSYTGAMAYVPDEAGGATIAFSDGTNWRRVQDRAVVSAAP